MAEAVLEVVLENLSSLIKKKLSLFLGVDEDLKSLASMLTSIKATLEDAEEKQFTDRAIKDWLLKLKDAAYVLDDILDECATKALKYEEGSKGAGPSNKVHGSFLSSLNLKHAPFRYKIAKKMKMIRERLDEIAAEKSKFHLTEIVREKEKRSRVIDWRETASNIDQPQVYGRDEDRDKIIDFFIREASELDELSVYPLIGIGGLGKTALAQLIFNHERVIDHFELTIWVCVSEDFSLKRMMKSIIESGCGHACEDLDLEPLQRKLSDLLQGKRYLLVLDDVWDEEQENWLRLRSVLARGGKGASVLVTTRLQKVAAIMDAKEANMSSKHLEQLSLSWGRNEESDLQENVEQILEVLQPQTQQLQVLGLGGYPGAHFPQWMSSPSLKDLKELKLLDCKSCLHLPHLAKLTSLKRLTISNMSHVIYLDEESCDGGVVEGFIALEFLLLDKLPNLISLSRDGRKKSFLHLSTLQITECPKLLGLPCLAFPLSMICMYVGNAAKIY